MGKAMRRAAFMVAAHLFMLASDVSMILSHHAQIMFLLITRFFEEDFDV